MEYPFFVNNFDRLSNIRTYSQDVKKIFDYPVAFWYGSRDNKEKSNMNKSIKRLLKRAEPQLPIFAIYNIPNRDIGQWSKGGSNSREGYLDFIRTFADGIGDKSPIIIYEPDALPHSTLLEKEEQDWRLDLMKESLEILTNNCNGIVYVDVGHPAWLRHKDAAKLLDRVSNEKVRGFSINVCNYRSTEDCLEWGRRICRFRKNDHFVIDTSRNGNGPKDDEWCNPRGRAIGEVPSTDTSHEKCDAYLWVKIPGESDGKCNGGLKAGRFWLEQGQELLYNSNTIK